MSVTELMAWSLNAYIYMESTLVTSANLLSYRRMEWITYIILFIYSLFQLNPNQE